MKTVLVTLMISLAFAASAQVVVDDFDINESDAKYVQLLGLSKFLTMTGKVTVYIDYGQEKVFGKDQRIVGPHGKAQVFNGMIDALNFMEENGWEYVSNYIISTQQQQVYYYLLRRK